MIIRHNVTGYSDEAEADFQVIKQQEKKPSIQRAMSIDTKLSCATETEKMKPREFMRRARNASWCNG